MDLGQRKLREKLNTKPNTNVAKNVIIFIGDGLGVSTVTAARIHKGQLQGKTGEEGSLFFENFPYVGLSKTYNTDRMVSDSAGTATAILCGVKTKFGLIGVDDRASFGNCTSEEGASVDSILKWANAEGKSTGIITTTRITHATPASGFAHSASRYWEADADLPADARGTCTDIAKQMIEGDGSFIKAVHAHGRQCSELLVSGKNPVPDSAITASSTWAVNVDTKHIPQRSRIDLGLDAVGNGGWSANFNDDKQWLQFDLGFSRKITGVITKGRQGYGTDQSRWQYVTAYRLQYGNATDDMSVYSDHDYEPEVFDGNWNPVTPQVQLLDPPINARYIRINPVKWHNHVSMRADLLGCPLTDTNKATIIG